MELAPLYPVRTERLRLRPLGEADIPALLAYRALPEVCRYVPFEPMDEATIRKRLADFWAVRSLDGEGQGLTLGLERDEDEQLIGDIILFFRSAEHRTGEIGWVINPNFGGQGYATEAAREGLRMLFEGLGVHRVVARIDARNGPSLSLAERLGMRREAHLRENEWFKGEWSDEIDYAMLDREWADQDSA